MNLTTKKEGKTVHQYVKTGQFKTMQVAVRFFDDLDVETTTKRHLALSMLKAKTRSHPTRRFLEKHLESLYDTSLSAHSFKMGNVHVNQFTLHLINPFYANGEKLLTEALSVLREMLFHPAFDEKTLREEKRFLADHFRAEYADKDRYAVKRYHDHLFSDHPARAHAMGEPEQIEDVPLSEIEKTHRRMLRENGILVGVVGDIDVARTHALVKEKLPFANERVLPASFFDKRPFVAREEVRETMRLQQERLFMTLSTGIHYGDADYHAALVMNTLFGEGSESLLFRRVRIEDSLAYHISSRYLPFYGLATIHSAMKKDSVEQAKARVEGALSSLHTGDFHHADLERAKNHLVRSVKHTFDSPSGLSALALRNELLSAPLDENETIASIRSVRKEDIERIAASSSFIFTFTLGGETDG